MKSLFSNMANLPGIDEIMNFLEVIKLTTDGTYETVIFDTAPTGHTLRFLEIPRLAIKMFSMFDQIKTTIQPILQVLGPAMNTNAEQVEQVLGQAKDSLELSKRVHESFTDPTKTTFVCVCIPEFLSLYETERLIQHLMRMQIDCSTVVVNQILNVSKNCECRLCRARSKMQQKYI